MSRVCDILYACVLLLTSPWLLWRALFRKRNRRGWGQKMFGLVPHRKSNGTCVWLHAVSVGEVNLLQPVMDRLQRQRPDVEFVISTSTETGFDLASEKYQPHCVFFYPFDFSWAIKRAINRLKPDLIVLAELEVWPNLVSIADENEIPVAVINGRLSESSFHGYRKIQRLLTPAFERLTHVSASTQQYADRFRAMGTRAERILVSGSMKFDGVTMDRKNGKTMELARAAGLKPDDFVIVAGSTQQGENLMIAKIYQELLAEHSNLKLILVPRHPETCPSVYGMMQRSGLSVTLRSEAGDGTSKAADVMLVDVIGELSAWWGCANAAFVGGSMGGAIGANRGGQNMIEPAAYGVPVSFGPDTRNFREIVSELLQAEAACVVQDEDAMKEFFSKVIAEPMWALKMGKRSRDLVASHAGASDRTVENLVQLLPRENSHQSRVA